MKQALISFLLVLLVESISVIVDYLKNRLMRHMHERDHDHEQEDDFGYYPDFM
ncbi:MAG: hypothetical protein ACXVBH_11095 [Flavisolibacter sp.]